MLERTDSGYHRTRHPDAYSEWFRSPRRVIKEHGEEKLKTLAINGFAFNHQRRQFLEQAFEDFVAKLVRVAFVLGTLAKVRGDTLEF